MEWGGLIWHYVEVTKVTEDRTENVVVMWVKVRLNPHPQNSRVGHRGGDEGIDLADMGGSNAAPVHNLRGAATLSG